MVEQAPHVAMDQGSDEDASEGLDLESVREIVIFVLRSPRRRPKLVATTFLIVATLGLTVSATMPRTYSSEVKLLAQRSAIHALTGQNTQVEDNPTKNVAAMIMRRDNLVALAKEADLPRRFDETRPPALKFKDRVLATLFGPLSDSDKLLVMVNTLATKLEVTVTDDSIVDITVDWSNPRLAYDLVTLVQKNFLEARYDSDVAVINDSIAVLEEHAKSELASVDAELDEYQKIVDARSAKLATPGAVPSPAGATARQTPAAMANNPIPAAQPVNPDVTRELEEKRLQIRALEEARQRTLDSLNQQLSQAQLTLTPMHPTVIALQQQIAAMSEPAPELTQLRADVRLLMAQIASPSGEASPIRLTPQIVYRAAQKADAQAPLGDVVVSPAPAAEMDLDGPLQLEQSKLGLAIRAYEDALVRLDATKVELDITGAAYKHRYTVVTPAELPARPKKETARLVGLGSVFGGALLALLLATGLDILSGLVLEPWQVQRRLKLGVLGELDNPS